MIIPDLRNLSKEDRDMVVASAILLNVCPFGEFDESTQSCRSDYFDCICVYESINNSTLKYLRKELGKKDAETK